MTANAHDRRTRIVVAAVLAGCWLWMARAHLESVDIPFEKAQETLHRLVVRNQAPDPYQYKLWFVSHAFESIVQATGRPLVQVSAVSTVLALAFLVLLHHLWLRSLVEAEWALVGGLTLAALANILFLGYYYHPYEFWGVALYCLLLAGIARGWPWHRLALVALAAGFVWEKHAIAGAVFTLLGWLRGGGRLALLLQGATISACALALPLAVRAQLGTARNMVDGQTTLLTQDWWKVLASLGPFVAPFLVVLALRFARVPPVVRLLWLALPLGVAAYLSQSFILQETRSFWVLVPVFTATVATALAPPRSP